MTTREVADSRAHLAELRSHAGEWKGRLDFAEGRLRQALAQETDLRYEADQIRRALQGAFQQNLSGQVAGGGQTILGDRRGVAAEMRQRLGAIERKLSERP